MKTGSQKKRQVILCEMIAIFVFFGTILSVEAWGATYYLSPQGSDAGSGTSSGSPWKTFSFAIPTLSPGDTLILANGTYNGGNSGYPSIRCGANATNGTSTQPITVKAQNERQAHLDGNGAQPTMTIRNCSYWTFEGLYVNSADLKNAPFGDGPISALDSDHLIFRRLLVTHNNRYVNSHLLLLINTHDSLLEENELYSYHRHALSMTRNSARNIARRNYSHSRGHGNFPGSYVSGHFTRGDVGLIMYPGVDNIVENNIVEDSGAGFEVEALGPATDNRLLGNIALDTGNGFLFRARGTGVAFMPQRTIIENGVGIGSTSYGGYFRSAKDTQCNNCTSIDSGLGGFAADFNGAPDNGDNMPTVFYQNSLAWNNRTFGFLMANQADYHISDSNVFGQSVPVSPSSPSNITNPSSIDPGLGSCRVFIPDGSPMKGAGKNGADIGANVLYRYQDGVLTNTPLWNVSTGEFTCGARVAGVNDIAGSSCFDVHKRLNVNTNGCSFPAGYGPGGTPDRQPPLAPRNLRVVVAS